MPTDEKSIKNLTFEEAMTELEGIVRSLESGNVKLDDALNAYSRGMELKGLAEKKLSEAKLKIEQLSVSGADELQTTDFKIEK